MAFIIDQLLYIQALIFKLSYVLVLKRRTLGGFFSEKSVARIDVDRDHQANVARWFRSKPILVIFLTEESPPSVNNFIPKIARKVVSCRLVSDIIANILSLITH